MRAIATVGMLQRCQPEPGPFQIRRFGSHRLDGESPPRWSLLFALSINHPQPGSRDGTQQFGGHPTSEACPVLARFAQVRNAAVGNMTRMVQSRPRKMGPFDNLSLFLVPVSNIGCCYQAFMGPSGSDSCPILRSEMQSERSRWAWEMAGSLVRGMDCLDGTRNCDMSKICPMIQSTVLSHRQRELVRCAESPESPQSSPVLHDKIT